MKKILNKILIITIIVISIMNFCFTNCSFAMEAEEVINSVVNIMGGVASVVFWPARILVTGIAYIANFITTDLAEWDNPATEPIDFLSPFHIFFNKCTILDVNFFDIEGLSDKTSVTYKIRIKVSQWFYIMRLLAVAILLIVLIYVGIRMALSSVAEDKARYKKMLFDWVCSLGLVFVLHYIAIFVIYANNAIVGALEVVAEQGAIDTIVTDIGVEAVTGIGIESFTSVLVYSLLIYQIVGYLIAYLNRMIKIGFLLIISPLIAITYSIDKMGDGKSQALNNWLKEFTYSILIQPFHCIIYITFIMVSFKLIEAPDSAGLIATTQYNQLANAILAVLCIKFIKDAEQMIRKIFNFADDDKGTSLASGLVASAYMIKKAKNIGKSARGVVNYAKDKGFIQGFGKDARMITDALKGTKFFGKIIEKAENIKDKIDASGVGTAIKAAKEGASKVKNFAGKASDKFRKFAENNKAIKGFKKGLEKGKRFWNSKPVKFMRKRNSIASVVGIAAGLANYAASDNGALNAIGAGNAAYQSADAFLSSSASTMGEHNADLISQRNEDRQEELNDAESDKAEYEKQRDDVENNLREAHSNLEDADEELQEIEDELQELEEEPEEVSNEGNSNPISERKANLLERREKLIEKKESLLQRNEEYEKELERLDNEIRTKELEIEKIQYDMECAESPERMEGYLTALEEENRRGEFNKGKSKNYTNITNKLGYQLKKAGKDDSQDFLQDTIEKMIKANPREFNIDEVLKMCLGKDIETAENYEKIRKSAKALKNFECDSQLAENLKFSNSMNVTTSKIAEKTYDSLKL